MELSNSIVHAHYNTDINECETSNGGCDHLCTNHRGSYSCSCLEGHTLVHDNRTCEGNYLVNKLADFHLGPMTIIDINECEMSNGGCDQICANIPGSYRCSCLEGHNLTSDSRKCEGISIGAQ